MQNKNIAIFINRYSENNFLSGGDKVNFHIIKAFSELGFSIDIFCMETTATNSQYVNHFYIKYADNDFAKDKYLFTIAENFYLNRTFLYIHENTRHFRNKYTRTNFTRFIQNIFAHKRKKAIDNFLSNEKFVIENTPYLLVPSTVVKDDILEFFNVNDKNIFVVPPCIDKEEINFKQTNQIFTFGLSARGFNNKGGWQVVFSSFLLKLFGKKFNILVIKPFADTLNPLKIIIKILGLEKNIVILDYCNNMAEEFYSKIDCLIMSSKREAFGLVAPEAMSLGIPVIVSSRCGIKDFIISNENGFVYDYKRPLFNLFKKMLYVLNNQNNLENISANSKKIYEKLSYERLKENIKSVLLQTNYL